MTPLVEMPAAALERKRGILELSPQELAAWLQERGQPPMRARQLWRWIVTVGAESFEQMTDLPKDLRQQLSAEFVPLASRIDQHQRAADDTHKLLLEQTDGRRVECVLIQQDGRRTACISTQVGCGMGCVFCASGLGGLDRNLATSEILEQLLRLRSLPAPAARLILLDVWPHVLVMGMGEPLANFDALLEALEAASARDGLGIGVRHITISTVGLPAKIRKLADLGKQYQLAVSLHASTDVLRSQIVATHPKAGLATILEAADYFHQKTGRQVTFEYVLLGGINDDVTHARELAHLLRGRQAHVNLIPFLERTLPESALPAVPDGDAASWRIFAQVLRQHRVSVKVRKRKASEIDAALRAIAAPGREWSISLTWYTRRRPEPSPAALVESIRRGRSPRG